MIRSLRIPLLIFFMLTGLWGTSPSADTIPNLTGEDVYQISRTFLRNHYSRDEFDENHSKLMFKAFLGQYDPSHYFFLQKDIDEFRLYEQKLKDLIDNRSLDFPLLVINRFKQRLVERTDQIQAILDGELNLETDETISKDRKNAPYPANSADAGKLWQVRVKFELLEQMGGGMALADAKEALRKRYRSFRLRIEQSNHNDFVSSWLNAFTAAYDPHSAYMSPDEYENFNISLRLSLEGIGATLRSEDGYTIVTSIIPGGAADREGNLKAEDKIVGVGQGTTGELEDVVNQRLADVVKQIRGPQGTQVRLSVMRTEGTLERSKLVTITRDKIVLKDGEAQSKIILAPADASGQRRRIGVITLPSFYVDFAERRRSPDEYKSSSQDVQRILEDFNQRKVDAVILDLRNNGGGGLDEAVSLSGLFLDSGPVVMVKHYDGRLLEMENPHARPVYRGPLAVITNRFSASASEILAGALKDYGRAVLVGESSTFGKGTVQNLFTLREGLGAIKTTVAKFYRPGSASTQNRGVAPDVVLPSVNNHLEIGESSLENALPWDSIAKARFTPWADLSPYLPVLQQRSTQRVEQSADFETIRGDVKTFLGSRDRQTGLPLRDAFAELKKGQQNGASKPRESGETPEPSSGKDVFLDEAAAVLNDFIDLMGGRDVARRSQM